MYSYEDRIRALKLYIKYGKRAAATVRELGVSLSKKSASMVPHLP